LAENFFEQDALVGDVLVDDPEAIGSGGNDEAVVELADGPEVAEDFQARDGVPDELGRERSVSVGNGGTAWKRRRRRDGLRGRRSEVELGRRVVYGLVEGELRDLFLRRLVIGIFDRLAEFGIGKARGRLGSDGKRHGGDRARGGEDLADGVSNKVVHEVAPPETDLGFRRVDVDIDFFRRQIEKEQGERVGVGRNNLLVSGA
jgi:hypothetical protein